MRLKLFVAESLKKSKQRFEEFKFEYFGGSDVANKLFAWLFWCLTNRPILDHLGQHKKDLFYITLDYIKSQ